MIKIILIRIKFIQKQKKIFKTLKNKKFKIHPDFIQKKEITHLNKFQNFKNLNSKLNNKM